MIVEICSLKYVHVNYQKKASTYNLTPSRKKVGKALARGSKKAVINECMKDPVMQKRIIMIVGGCICSELASMCSEAANSLYINCDISHFQNKICLVYFT